MRQLLDFKLVAIKLDYKLLAKALDFNLVEKTPEFILIYIPLDFEMCECKSCAKL